MSKKGFTYTLQIDAEINNLIAKTNQVKKSMESIMAAGKAPGAEKLFDSIERAIDRLQQKAAQPINSTAAFSGIQKEAAAVGTSLSKLGNIIEELGKIDLAGKMDLLPPDLKKKIEEADAALQIFEQTAQKAAQKSRELTEAETNLAAAKRELNRVEGKAAEKKSLVKIQENAIKTAQDEADAIKAKKEALEKFLKTQAAYEAAGGDKRKVGGGKKELEGMNLPADRKAAAVAMPDLDLKDTQAVQAAIAQLGTEYSQASKKITDAEATQRRYTKSLGEWENKAQVTKNTVSNLEQTVAQLNTEFEKNKLKDTQAAYIKLRTEAGRLGVDLSNIPVDYTEQSFIELDSALKYLATNGIAQVDTRIEELQNQFEDTGASAEAFGEKVKQAGAEVEGLDKRTADVSALKSRITHFIGLEGAMNIAQNAMRNAFETVKSLDKAMTEMAVVTELSVGDYWEQLPDYTERANALGVSIQGAYEAATLYYQQGLKSNEVTAMTNETLKMARVAGLGAEDATNKMTAALRGFNMELNETSAQRIADVYSELAAITASDVDEISSAMTKTASIAASAGMEFETTAAFLSQIIETTRESAETAGTAMKTVVARFQELKKDPAEIGEVEGEIVDANKIETALRSVGVALRDSSGQFRELDDVFLELSSKWDGLDTNTQRYIATIAAGSRQQSRFIAMMSDYSRTQELVAAANNSAGASNEQFEKTMDSLETKLTQLKNSWDTFTMSLMNNEVIKMGVDLLTNLMNTINGIVELFDKIGLGSVASFGMVVGALALGSKALDSFEHNLLEVDKNGRRVNTTLGSMKKVGTDAFAGLKKGIKGLPESFDRTRKKLTDLNKTAAIAGKQDFVTAKKNYTKALKEAEAAQNHYNVLQFREEEGSERLAKADKNLVASKAALTASQGDLFTVMELTDDQIAEANAMTLNGVSADSAAILSKSGWTAATLAQAAAAKGKTQAEMAEQMTAKLTEKATLQSTIAKGLNALSTKLQEKAEKGGIGAKAASTVATWLQTAANWALNASMGPLLLVILAVVVALISLVAIIILVVAAFKKWQANQPDAKLAALEESAKQAQETAKATKEVYDQLLTSRDEYEGMVDTLDNLTEGTSAWKEAVSELNAKVLELIAIYPQLARFLQVAENGVMTIDSAGWDKVIKEQEERVAISQQMVAKRQADVVEQKKSMNGFNTKYVTRTRYYENGKEISVQDAYKGVSSNSRSPRAGVTMSTVTEKRLDYDVGVENQAALERLSQLTWGTQEYNTAMAELRRSIGSTNTEQLAALNSFDATAKTLAELTKQEEMYEQQALRVAGSFEARADANHERIVASLADSYDEMEQVSQAQANKKWKNKGGMWTEGDDSTNDALLLELGEYGLATKGNEKADMAQLLAAKGGRQYTADEIAGLGKYADNQLAIELAEIDAAAAIGDNYIDKLYQLQEENAQLGALYSGSLDVDLNTIQTEVDAIKTADGILEKALNNRIKTVKQGQKDVDLELQKIYNNSGIDAKQFAGSYDQAKQFINTYNEMLSGVGAGLAISFADMFQDFDPSQQKAFFDQYSDINWSSSIEGAATLKEMLQSGDVALQEFATKTLALESATYSATAQMNEFYKSLSPETLQELAADGKIAATEIMELAKSNDKLATMMDTTGVSAAALGHYYELLEDGTISAYEATTNFTKALAELNAASNSIEDSFAFIDTFEPSRSQTEISDYFSDMRESAMELYEMGAYGDQQLQDYIEGFLGEDTWKQMIEDNVGDMKAAMYQAMAQINTYGENLYGAWQQLAAQGLEGISVGEDGAIQFDLEQIGNVENLKQQIMDMGWSDAMADALIADAQTFSAELSAGLKTVDVEKGLQTWLSEAMQINGKTIIPKGQIKAMAKELGTTVEQLTADLESKGVQVMDLLGEDGLLGEDMRKQIIETAKAAGEFDLDTNYQLLLELGLDDKEAKDELKGMASSLTNVPFKLNGETIQRTGEVVYDSTGAAVENSSSSGLIDGLVDPKVKAAQELSALEQGEMMAKANATGSIVASRMALQASAEGIDNLINGAIDILNLIPGVNIAKSNLAGSVGRGTEALVNKATGQIESMNSSKRSELQGTISKTTDKVDYSDIAADLADKYTNDTDTIVGAYENKNAQGSGVLQKEVWENPYDELYNLNYKLNAAIREREKLERNYERAVKDSGKSAQDLADITAQELASLKEEAKVQKDIAQAALKNIEMERAENTQYSRYYTYDTKTNTIQVDWEAVDRAGWNADEGAEFEEFISYLEEQTDTAKEAQDALDDIEDSVDEIQKRGRDSTSEIYNQVKEGLIQERQEQIDKLQAINDAIQEAQSALVDQMQKQIDEARQARDNKKTENKIADKETRLAYLMRDTSGGNAMEIASLQKEIEETKQGYTDSLIDQQLQSLQDANEHAAEQRQEQIDLAQAQLDSYTNSAEIWSEVKKLVDAGFQQVAQGVPFVETEAGKLAMIGEEVEAMNPFEAEDFATELNNAAKEGAIYQGFVKVTGEEGVTTIAGLATSITNDIATLKADSENPADNDTHSQGEEEPKNESETVTVTPDENIDILLPLEKNASSTYTSSDYRAEPIVDSGGYSRLSIAGMEKKYNVILKAYAGGGLADQTGPAWLDGTKSRPEIVLNQTDSANFMQLRDILADILQGTSNLSGTEGKAKGGDNYFDIEINVESINDDYDVEQLADKIRDMIYEDSTYRNVNSISGLR